MSVEEIREYLEEELRNLEAKCRDGREDAVSEYAEALKIYKDIFENID